MKFRSRYVRDYLSHSKMRRVLVWGVQILAVVLLALVTAVLFFSDCNHAGRVYGTYHTGRTEGLYQYDGLQAGNSKKGRPDRV